MTVVEQITSTLGDCSAFYKQQTARLLGLGIDASEFEVSHIAFRTQTLEEYARIRDALEGRRFDGFHHEAVS